MKKYLILLFAWIFLLIVVSLSKFGVFVKFIPYILGVAFVTLLVASWKVAREKENVSKEKDSIDDE